MLRIGSIRAGGNILYLFRRVVQNIQIWLVDKSWGSVFQPCMSRPAGMIVKERICKYNAKKMEENTSVITLGIKLLSQNPQRCKIPVVYIGPLKREIVHLSFYPQEVY